MIVGGHPIEQVDFLVIDHALKDIPSEADTKSMCSRHLEVHNLLRFFFVWVFECFCLYVFFSLLLSWLLSLFVLYVLLVGWMACVFVCLLVQLSFCCSLLMC